MRQDFKERGPGSNITPTNVHRYHNNVLRIFHDGKVERYFFDRAPQRIKLFRRFRDFLQDAESLSLLPLKFCQDLLCLTDKDATAPTVDSFASEGISRPLIRF